MSFKRFAMIAVLAVAPVSAQATVLLDGSFEVKGANGLAPSGAPITSFCYDSGNPLVCRGGAWTGSGIIKDGSAAWGGVSSPAGEFYAFVQTTQVMSQTFTATRNELGTVSWIDRNRFNSGGAGLPKTYEVTISDGVELTSLGTFTSVVGTWTPRVSSDFRMFSGVDYTLSFRGLAPTGDRTAFIDNVSLATVAVPEPAAWAMLIAGFGFVGAAARRKRAFVVG